ncbi:RNA pyrophosphohydrolase [Marinagarivorans cellulosilyticus]|uniref:RNA pyrophosphohydrolase n=1 Tax=Marinagarivorans cellulosilyticus TaxID=2721545 RepID=A0AAN2BM18_9GAMM|nr:RNA pyrophosphohydrolase [Marinagarivorans cellulosilyticus]BCD99723.1 putative (di)nucleoside polyphosphate hydrolase [Marinagarivorans cellulosilyticus]
MIDAEGFRPNVGIMLMNTQGKLLWARRIGGQNAWQFPQGGIKSDETPEQALYRELKEEVGLSPEQVSVVDVTRGWLRYRLPKRFVRQQQPVCIGQKQKWFLLEYNGADNAIDLSGDGNPEFDTWEWVSYWYPLNRVVNFKRDVYRRAMRELAPAHANYEEASWRERHG